MGNLLCGTVAVTVYYAPVDYGHRRRPNMLFIGFKPVLNVEMHLRRPRNTIFVLD